MKKDAEIEELMKNLTRFRANNQAIMLEAQLDKENPASPTNKMRQKEPNMQPEQEIETDTGFIYLEDEVLTINQVLAQGTKSKDVDNVIDNLEETQNFSLRAYSGIIEILFKFASLVLYLDTQSFGSVPEELQKSAQEVEALVKSFRDSKKIDMPEEMPDSQFEMAKYIMEFKKDKEEEDSNTYLRTLSSDAIVNIFIKLFGGNEWPEHQKSAVQFDSIIQHVHQNFFLKLEPN